jgi:hypothetical protein
MPEPDELDLQPLDLQPIEQPSLMSRAYHAISDPLLTAPSRWGQEFEDYISTPKLNESPMMAMAKGAVGGGIKGVGDLVSGLSSPANIAMTVGSMGSNLAAESGMSGLSTGLNAVSKLAAVPGAIHGGSQILDPNTTLGEKGFGLAELAGSGAAMMHTPGAKSPTLEEATSKLSGKVPELDLQPIAAPREMPIGTKVTFKAGKTNPEMIKAAVAKGFEYKDMTDDGGLVFVKTKETAKPPVLESEVGNQRIVKPPDTNTGSPVMDALNIPRTLMASGDLSAPFRQGLGLIHKGAFWKALPTMMESFGSEAVYKAAQEEIRSRPLFKPRPGPNGTILPSFAESMGLKLSDLGSMSTREESIMSSMAEKVPGVRPSNRAYTIFLNKLRADVFQDLVDKGQVFGADGTKNLALGKELANFVNTATGRGNLGIAENAGKFLSTFMFSPRLMASRLTMLNPQYYITANPMVRKEALKSLMAVAAAGNTVLQLGKMMGGTVENNPASSDYGKLKVGNTRIDPFGGFQQYIVAAKRLLPNFDLNVTPNPTNTGAVPLDLATGMTGTQPGQMKSTTTGIQYDLSNPRYGQSNRAVNFAWGLMAGKKELSGKPMDMSTLNPFENAIAQRFMPMVMQDMYDLYNDTSTPIPVKALAGAGSILGMGVQNYGQ